MEEKGFILDLITHIHQNPQIHGMVSNFRIWPFSSYQVYINQNLRSVVTKELFSDYELYNTISIIHEDYLPYSNQDA